MSNEEIVTTTTIVYDVRGIDQSIRSSQSLLFTVNAVRLGVEDFKRLGEDPSFSNFLWTGIQLTRIWTNLLRLVRRTNQAQRFGLLQGAAGRGGAARGIGAVRGLAFGQQTLGGVSALTQPSLVATIATALGISIPTLGILTGAVVGTVLVVGADIRDRKLRDEWRKRQADIAKLQGLEF